MTNQPGVYYHTGSAIESVANHLQNYQGAHRAGILSSVFAGGAHGSARQAWIELARPLSTINLNAGVGTPNVIGGAGTGAGLNLVLPVVQLPIGMDIKNIICSICDIDVLQWSLVQFTFGTLTLVNPVSTPAPASLAPFDPRLAHVDRIAPWIGAKTKTDVQASATVQNSWVGGTFSAPVLAGANNFFHGFSIQAYQEEQVCAIQTRIEPTGRNVGNYDIISQLMHGYAAIAGTQPSHPQYQPHAATGSVHQVFGPPMVQQMGGTPNYYPGIK